MRHQRVKFVQHIRHAQGGSELADPLPNGSDVGLGMRGKQAFDVLEILGPPGNGLHNEQVFDAR